MRLPLLFCPLCLVTLICLTFAPPSSAQWLPLNPVKSVEPRPDGALIVLENGYLRLQVCSDSIVHITYSVERTIPQHPDFLVSKTAWPKAEFSLRTDDPKTLSLETSQLKVEVTRLD